MKTYHYVFKGIKPILLFCLLLGAVAGSYAQSSEIVVKGTVRSDTAVLEGVTVSLKSNPSVATFSDGKGHYTIKVPSNGTLVFSFVGFNGQEIEVKGEPVINVILRANDKAMEEVAVVAYGTQKKKSMVSAVTTINPKELKGPTSNLTTMLAGKISGIIAYQRSGEPGRDNASFFIRGVTTFGAGKVDPLILIDNMESTPNDLARLQPDDISGFSVLKDATAASLYGARGANGVILVTTKVGVEGKTKFSVRAENSTSSNTKNFRFTDNITYMKLANEALVTRYPLRAPLYTQEKIAATEAGGDPNLYPNNDWLKMLIKDYTNNQRYNMNMSGGGKIAQYYVSGSYNVDNGVLKENGLNNFNSNIKLRSYQIRTNVTINATPTTVANIRVSGQFDDYNGPVGGGGEIFNQALKSNPVMFSAVYPSSYLPRLNHPLFGSALDANGIQYNNPYANMVSGYQQSNTSTMTAQLDLRQNLGFITSGLSARMMTFTQRYASFSLARSYNPFYYSLAYGPDAKTPVLTPLNINGTEYLNYVPGAKILNTTSYLEAALNYNRSFGDHDVSGMLITTMRNYLTANSALNDLQQSLPYRNQGLSGRFTYGYNSRYMAEFNFGYNGSERFSKNNRLGFFPSGGLAWNVHNERFFDGLSKYVSVLKLRGTYGLVGNDQIGSSADRFFYLSSVNMNDDGKGAVFGENFGTTLNGVTVMRYANSAITWEKSFKTNIGMDVQLTNGLNFTMDVYKEHRKNILMVRSYVPSSMGLVANIQANVGEAEGKGVDMQMDYNKSFKNGMWLQLRGNFTYAHSKLLVNEEPDYASAWSSKVGYPLSQRWGLIAERLFVDDEEVKNSPVQDFGQVRGGDLKYLDVDGNNVIDGNGDQVPIGYPEVPEIVYGGGFSFGYKQFDFSAFFQGSARSSIFIDNNAIQPFKRDDQGRGYENGLLKIIAEDHWSEDNRNVYAFWPRLSDQTISNNQWTSTWWMRNGAFLRLKTVELGYTLPQRLLKRFKMTTARFYLNGTNLFVISGFKLWDPEMGSNGLAYPVQRVFNVGVNLSF
ncbi:TonB-dependent receptor [Paraflavitalea sp. CAU 1676]|uniref:SusC/RagA family TonB-linked outer membrane protein n=1 Tax=Paraflavitalea sp. CAU 1676 TaxID=3032598 RepID=UPI0023DADEC8|nr:TonB-dependent receptor [Paraflavitalea sp. CAU 1676]MDF2188828.1 TonB-dependent receptor [Paraflavitalea sp. CAU 1676]